MPNEDIRRSIFVIILPWALVVGLLIGGVMLYGRNRGLGAETSRSREAQALWETERATLTQRLEALEARLDLLSAENTDLANQLSIFASATGSSPVDPRAFPVTLKGKLWSGGAYKYSLITPQNIVIRIENSNEPKVEAALRPFLGKEVEVRGTHRAGLPRIVATHVDGLAIQ